MLRANMTRDVLWLTVSNAADPHSIEVRTGTDYYTPLKTDKLEARDKCLFITKLKLVYNSDKSTTLPQNYKKVSADASIDIGPVMASEGNDIPGWYRLTIKGADEKYCNVLISK